MFHGGWNGYMKKDLHKLLKNFQDERRVLVETFYIYEYKVKSKYIFILNDFNTIATFS